MGRKLLLCLVVAAAVLALTGCAVFAGPLGSLMTDLSFTDREDEAFRRAAEGFFDALDRGDGDAIREMFSPRARQTAGDLDEQIAALTALYPGPTDVNTGADTLRAGHYSNDHGTRTASAYATFPVVSGGRYFWCHMELCYVSDADPDQLGLTRVLFFAAEDWCACRYDPDWKLPQTMGLTVFAGAPADERVRAVGGYPYRFESDTAPLDPESVLEFLEQTHDYGAFVTYFGAPNAVNIYEIYELIPADGCKRYLRLSVDKRDPYHAVISEASVVDDLDWLYQLWHK